MEINNKNLSQFQWQKIGFLISEASKLGIDCSGYGFADINNNSGNTYLWLEDYNFSLYIPPFCRDKTSNELTKHDIEVCYSCPIDGEEEFNNLEELPTLKAIEKWVTKLEKQSRKKEKEVA